MAVGAEDRVVAEISREAIARPERLQRPHARGDLLGAHRSFKPRDLVGSWQPLPVRRPAIDQPVEQERKHAYEGDCGRPPAPRLVAGKPRPGKGGDEAGWYEDDRRRPARQFAAVYGHQAHYHDDVPAERSGRQGDNPWLAAIVPPDLPPASRQQRRHG